VKLPENVQCVVDEIDATIRQWESFQPGGGQHVGTRPNLTPGWIQRLRRWSMELKGDSK